ncbi:MAG: MFS transporter [Sulfolobaceae archaeon]|nr:MFS transporter [Sulfolobaceae archaeon]
MESIRFRVLALTSLAHFLNDGTALVYSLLIVYYHEILSISLVILGAISIVYTLLSGVVSPFIGDFADKHDLDAPLLSLGIALEGIGIGLLALPFVFTSLSLPLVVLGAVILGFGQAFYHPIGGEMLARAFGNNAGRHMGINGAMGSVGRAVTPSIITLLILALGDSLGLGIVSIYMIIASLIIYYSLRFFKKDISSTAIRKKNEKLDSSLKKFLIVLLIIVFMRNMFITGVTTFIGQYVFDIFNSKALVGLFLTIGFLGSILGQPFFGYLTEKKGGAFSFILSSLITIIFFVAFMLIKVNFLLSGIIFTVVTFAAFTAFPVLMGYVAQTFPKSFVTVANSYVWGIGVVVGGSAGTAMVTALLGLGYSLALSFWILTALAVVSLALTPLLLRRGKY